MSTPSQSMIEQQAIQAAQKAGVSPAVFLGLIQQESSFNPNAESSAGAIGLTQFEPSTLEGMGISVSSFLNSITVQLQAGADYLASLLTRYNGNYSLALAAYNAGSGAVDEPAPACPGGLSKIRFIVGELCEGRTPPCKFKSPGRVEVILFDELTRRFPAYFL